MVDMFQVQFINTVVDYLTIALQQGSPVSDGSASDVLQIYCSVRRTDSRHTAKTFTYSETLIGKCGDPTDAGTERRGRFAGAHVRDQLEDVRSVR